MRSAPVPCVVMIAGIALTLAAPLWLVIVGAHGDDRRVLRRARAGHRLGRRPGAAAGVGGVGQASALYMCAYYAGSSVFGTLAGVCWSVGRWPAVVASRRGLATVALLLMLALRRTASLR